MISSNPNITSSMNLLIPHLAVGQTVQEWQSGFIASTITLTAAQRLEVLPSYVNRYPGETELAKIAAKKGNVAAAFKELAKLIDGKTDEISDFKEFIDCRLGCSEIVAQKAFLFDLHKKGVEAGVPTDMICKKFFAEIPGGSKLYDAHKDKVKAEMTEADLVALLQAVQEKMRRTGPTPAIKEEVFISERLGPQERPAWADEMFSEMRAIKRAVGLQIDDGSSEASYDPEVLEASRRTGEEKCLICDKKGHSKENCWMRVCKFCSGKGHDLDQCASLANKKKFKSQTNRKV